MNFKSFFAFAIVLVFTFVSCEDEPLEGNFNSDNPDDIVGTFTAEVDGVSFIAASSSAVSSGGKTEITGFKSNGDIIVLTLDGTGTGSFDLSATAGEGNFGIDFDASLFTTNHVDGGGTVEVTEYSATSGRISGTFAFTAAMQLVDANGQPVLDNNGNPMYQMLEVTEGQFTNILLTSEGIDPTDPDPGPVADFYAEINSEPYSPGGRKANYWPEYSSIDIEGFIPNSIEMIRLRIEDPGVGTFIFEFDNVDTFGFYIKPGAFYSTNLYPGGGGSVTITTFDLENNAISGTFEFFAINDDDETVDVTNGSFNNVPILIN